MIALGSDHGGYELKQEIISHLESKGIAYRDYGSFSPEPADYPEYAHIVAHVVVNGECEKGILICGTDCFTAEATRLHNDANILALGGRVVGPGLALKIVDTFLNTPFSGEERHSRRISKIEESD